MKISAEKFHQLSTRQHRLQPRARSATQECDRKCLHVPKKVENEEAVASRHSPAANPSSPPIPKDSKIDTMISARRGVLDAVHEPRCLHEPLKAVTQR
jgi:hypothetical protein